MISQGNERDTLMLTNQQFQIPFAIPSPSISFQISENGEESSSTFSSSYFQLLGSIDESHTPVVVTNYSASKRALEQQLAEAGDSDECADPKKRRLMKNRESATRSRARKQALMNELKVEVARLEEENLRIKEQCKQLKSALAAANASTMKLRRVSSATF